MQPFVQNESEGDTEMGRLDRQFNTRTLGKVVFLGMGTLAQGYAGGIISTTIGQPSFKSYMGMLRKPWNPCPIYSCVNRADNFATCKTATRRNECHVLCWGVFGLSDLLVACKQMGS